MILSEVFGPTLQGEGPAAGRLATFVRVGRCNLDCSWCDTPYTWDWSRFDPAVELRRADDDDVLRTVLEQETPLVVITGGEPLLQGGSVATLTRDLRLVGKDVHIETNGTRAPLNLKPGADAHYIVSPKLAGSGVDPAKAIVPQALALFIERGADFKFVITCPDDVQQVADLVAVHGIASEHVWLMAEGRSGDDVAYGFAAVAEAAIAHRWNACTRLHVLAWGDARGH